MSRCLSPGFICTYWQMVSSLRFLRDFQRLRRIVEDAAGVDHRFAEEPVVEVVAAVVDVRDVAVIGSRRCGSGSGLRNSLK